MHEGRVLTLSLFYMHLACSPDFNKVELMLWIQKYVHIFSHSMEQPWFSYHFLHCFQLQLRLFCQAQKDSCWFLKIISLARFSIEANLMVGNDFYWALYTIHLTYISWDARLKICIALISTYRRKSLFVVALGWVYSFFCFVLRQCLAVSQAWP